MRIFLSHITEEAPIAEVLKDWIESSFLGQCDVFVSSDRDSISAGSRWLEEIDQALKSAVALLVLCSPAALHRPWINFETGCGWIKRVPIIPICHSGQTRGTLPSPISMFQALEIGTQSFVPDLLSSLAKHLNFAKVPRIDQKTMEAALSSAVARVSQGRTPSTPNQKTADQSNDLPEECVKILATIAGTSPRSSLSAEELAGHFGMPTKKMRYYLDILVDNHMVKRQVPMGSPSTYSVSQAGRKLLV